MKHLFNIGNLTKIIVLIIFTIAVISIVNINSDSNIFSTKPIILEEDQAEVIRVVDGDTIVVRTHDNHEEVVRMLLIDSPESVHPNKDPEKYGKEASNFLKEKLPKGQIVYIERGQSDRDKYNRLLAHIWIADKNIGLLSVKEGLSRVAYVFEPNTEYLEEFQKAEISAERNELNIWEYPDYVTDDGFDMSKFDNLDKSTKDNIKD